MTDLSKAIKDLRKLEVDMKRGRSWRPADSERLLSAIRAMEMSADRLVFAPVGREFGSPEWRAAENAGKLAEYLAGEWAPKPKRKK